MPKITGTRLKFVSLVKLLHICYANLNSENLENTSKFEGWGVTLVAHKKCVFFLLAILN